MNPLSLRRGLVRTEVAGQSHSEDWFRSLQHGVGRLLAINSRARSRKFLPGGLRGEYPPLTRQLFVLLFDKIGVLLFDKIGATVGEPLAFSCLGAVFLGSQLPRRQQSRHDDTDILALPSQSSDKRFMLQILYNKYYL